MTIGYTRAKAGRERASLLNKIALVQDRIDELKEAMPDDQNFVAELVAANIRLDAAFLQASKTIRRRTRDHA